MDASKLCAVLLNLCLAAPLSASQQTDSDTVPYDAALLYNDSCRLALTQPSVNARSADAELIRSRALRDRSVTSIERLGWAYLSSPRDRYSDERLYLTGRIADCLRESAPHSTQAMLLAAKVAHEQHRFAHAESIADQLARQRGSWFDFAVLGDVLAEQGKIDAATAAYQRMADLNPGSQTYSRIAHIRWLTGDLDGAMEMMAMAIQASSTRDVTSAVWTRSTLAGYLFEAGRHDTAIAVANQALAFQHDHAQSLFTKGRAMIETGRPSAGIEILRSATESSPLPVYRWALAEALADVGRVSESNAVRHTLFADGQRHDPRTFALYLASTGQSPDTALEIARRELQGRQDPLTLDVAAWAAWRAEKYALAADYIERSLASGIQHPRIDFHAALIVGHVGDTKRALALAIRAQRAAHFLLPSERRLLSRITNPVGGVINPAVLQPTHQD